MLDKFAFLLFMLTLTVHNCSAIECNFTFVEGDSAGSVNDDTATQVIQPADESRKTFNCDQSLDDDLEFQFVNDSAKLAGIVNRFNSNDNFELLETSCVTSKRFIAPRALNNIYNQLTVLNSATFVQRIQITECRSLREPCNDQVYPAPNFRYICWQEYLTIKLSAVRNIGTVYDEDFYYPSHCSCRLIRVTRKTRKAQIIYV